MSITIYLDDKPLPMPTGSTLADLLAQLQRAPDSVATALNGQFVARDARPDTVLSDGDQVLLFKPIVGG
jgi:sulfur carrier protein